MIKKKVAAIITASIRLCKCGETVAISAVDDKTLCPKCGAVVHEEKNDTNNNGETIHEKKELKARDSSTESDNPK